MQKLNLRKKIMQAALLLGASRGYVGKNAHCLTDQRLSSSMAVVAVAYSAIATQALPMTFVAVMCLGIMFIAGITSFVNGMATIQQKGTDLISVPQVASSILFFVGIMYLECYVWPTQAICIISLLTSGYTFFYRATHSTPKLGYTVLLVETLISLFATICAFTPISFFGIPAVLVILYLKVALHILTNLSRAIDKTTWAKINL